MSCHLKKREFYGCFLECIWLLCLLALTIWCSNGYSEMDWLYKGFFITQNV